MIKKPTDKNLKECMYIFESEDKDKNKDNDDEYVANKDRITKPFMTKYEKVRLKGLRETILASGAKPLIKNSEGLSSEEIVELELEKNLLPFYIIRPRPDGKKEKWHIRELMH